MVNERRIVAVVVDLKTGRSVKNHEELVAAVERLEGSEVDDSPAPS